MSKTLPQAPTALLMRLFSPIPAFAALVLAGCAGGGVTNPCYEASQMVATEATGDELIAAADSCIAAGGERKQGLLVRAAGHVRNKNFGAVVSEADAALGIDPEYADAWYYRGYGRAELGEREAARSDFDRAIELGLPPVFAFKARGRVKFVENDFVGAWRDFDEVVRADPEDEEAYRLRGAAAAVLERFDAAEADLSRTIELDPEDLKAYSARGYVRYLTSRYAEAASDLRMAMRDETEGLKTAFLFLAMRAAGDPNAWGELRMRAAGLDPDSYPGVFPFLFLGRVTIERMIDVAERTGTHSEAENRSEAYFYAGQMELMNGDRAAARRWFEKVLETGVVRFDEVRAARKELRAMGVAVPSPDPERAPES